jgi:hypothetical protein
MLGWAWSKGFKGRVDRKLVSRAEARIYSIDPKDETNKGFQNISLQTQNAG